MDWLKSLFLGLVQGLTEFLPVSSSGHLVIIQHYLDTNLGNATVFFDLLLHLATLVAVVFYYKRQLVSRFSGAYEYLIYKKAEKYADYRYLTLIGLASVPTFIIGFLIDHYLKNVFESSLFAAFGLIGTGVILLLSKFLTPKGHTHNLQNSLFLGIVQGLAIFPGISRSGSTISASMALGFTPKEAAEFSFILSIPAILGASCWEVLNNYQGILSGFHFHFLLGFIAAFFSGLWALRFLNQILIRHKFHRFGYYCLAAGILAIVQKIIL